MNEGGVIFTVDEATGKDGKVIGWLIKTPDGDGALIFADQVALPGIRLGDHFVPRIRETVTYTKVFER